MHAEIPFNDLDLGEIGGLPRLMDMGQCNDAYSAIKVAVALAEAFGCSVNELPLSMVLSWYEQKAVCILLTLLHLGIQNIKLGPTLPAFISPNVLAYLVEHLPYCTDHDTRGRLKGDSRSVRERENFILIEEGRYKKAVCTCLFCYGI